MMKIVLNGLIWENTRSLQHFLFFSPREQKKCYSFSQTFFGSLRRFLHSLHSLRVATSGAEGCYVLRFGHPKGDPGLRSGLHSPPLQTPRPFAPFVPFRSFRKVVRDPKKSFENEHFFCSLVIKKKKKLQRTFSILKS